jgi:hypothetical protein
MMGHKCGTTLEPRRVMNLTLLHAYYATGTGYDAV